MSVVNRVDVGQLLSLCLVKGQREKSSKQGSLQGILSGSGVGEHMVQEKEIPLTSGHTAAEPPGTNMYGTQVQLEKSVNLSLFYWASEN